MVIEMTSDGSVVALPVEQLAAVRRLMIAAVVNRGFPVQDAEDVVQDVLEKIATKPAEFAERLAALDQHKYYFMTMAFNSYLMMLRSERRRRQREDRHASLASDDAGDDGDDRRNGSTVLVLADIAPLTPRQRQYIRAVFDEHLAVEEIAARSGTSPRAVRAVLARAAACIRRHLLRSAA